MNKNKLSCHYEGCTEEFETHKDRLAHSLKEHWNIRPSKYRYLTGRDPF